MANPAPVTDIAGGGEPFEVLTRTDDWYGRAWRTITTGIPSGGTTGQVLTRTDTGQEWAAIPLSDTSVPDGSITTAKLADGAATAAKVGNLPASKITSGTLSGDRLPNIPLAKIPNLPAARITSGTLADARIPSLATSKITTGTFASARLATGGTDGQVLTRTSTGQAWESLPDTTLADGAVTTAKLADGAVTDAKVTSVGAGKITGTLDAARIPNLSAGKITSGTLGADRIPDLNASKITTGTFADARIPSLAAAKITSGTFSTDRIPDLAATKITSGTFALARLAPGGSSGQVLTHLGTAMRWRSIPDPEVADIPDLPASKITSGTFADARIPNLNASKITAGTFSDSRIPSLNASKIAAGVLNTGRLASGGTDGQVLTRTSTGMEWEAIPLSDTSVPDGSITTAKLANLAVTDAKVNDVAAGKITGTLADARIPSLNASKITAGTFAAARIPNLAASKITSGTFDRARIPAVAQPVTALPASPAQGDLIYVTTAFSSGGVSYTADTLYIWTGTAWSIKANRGLQGATGAQGERGATGATGATGAAGADGADGQDGQDGAPGAPGAPGIISVGSASDLPASPATGALVIPTANFTSGGVSFWSGRTFRYSGTAWAIVPRPINAGDINSGTLAAARVGDLPASKITSGQLATARVASGTATQGHVPTVNASGSLVLAAQSGGGGGGGATFVSTTAEMTAAATGATKVIVVVAALTYNSTSYAAGDQLLWYNNTLTSLNTGGSSTMKWHLIKRFRRKVKQVTSLTGMSAAVPQGNANPGHTGSARTTQIYLPTQAQLDGFTLSDHVEAVSLTAGNRPEDYAEVLVTVSARDSTASDSTETADRHYFAPQIVDEGGTPTLAELTAQPTLTEWNRDGGGDQGYGIISVSSGFYLIGRGSYSDALRPTGTNMEAGSSSNFGLVRLSNIAASFTPIDPLDGLVNVGGVRQVYRGGNTSNSNSFDEQPRWLFIGADGRTVYVPWVWTDADSATYPDGTEVGYEMALWGLK